MDYVYCLQDWVYKLSDFGLSRAKDKGVRKRAMTQCGSPIWTAPEIFRAEVRVRNQIRFMVDYR